VSRSSYLRIKKTTPYYNIVRRIAFPSTNVTVISLFAVNILGIALAFSIADFTASGLVRGVSAGLMVFLLPTLLSALISTFVVVRGDPLFFPRRVLALSLFGGIVWTLVMLIGAVVSRMSADFLFPSRAFYLGLFVILPLRSIAVFSMSSVDLRRRGIFAVSDPLACSIALFLFLGVSSSSLAAALALSVAVSFTFAFTFLIYVERRGMQTLGASPLRIFKAFLKDWLDGDFSTLENYLEIFGVDSTINISVLKFRSKTFGKMKGAIIIPSFHPGPFLNVGSSALPYMIKRVVESATGGVAAVTHGISGHELNLVSHHENEKLIEKIISMLDQQSSESEVTPLIRSNAGIGTATCQAFGDSALVTMTVAPHDVEDIDVEVGDLLRRSSEGLFKQVALVDAHNSLEKVTVMGKEELNDLAKSAKLAIKAARGAKLGPLSMGAAQGLPRDISLKEGMGLGGIVVFWLRVDKQSFAYVVIDSNNMAKGLRGKILEILRDMGMTDGEIMTSDTHMVNGIVSAKLGYYPLGAATDPRIIIGHVKTIAEEAKRNVELVEASMSSSEVEARTLGMSSLNHLMSFVLKTTRLTFTTLFPVMLVIAAISFLFLI